MKLHLPVFLRKSLLSCLAAVIVCTVGSGAAWAEPQNLTHHGSYLYWDTQSESFANEDKAAAAFTAGDNVSFTGESTVTLGEDISAGTVAIEKGADVTIDLDVFELNVDRIELSGLLDMGYSLHIGEGTTLAVQSAGAVLDSNLVLGDKGGFEVGAAASLNNNLLTLQGNTSFTLTAAGDGKTYTLLSGVSGLLDAQGNAISLDSSNNAASLYFDTTQPGTGFWENGTLQLNNGALQIVLHNETVKEAITITSRQTNPSAYQYYAGISFEDISNVSSSSARGGAIYGDTSCTITLSNNGSVTFSGNTASGSYSAYGGAIYGYEDVTLSNNGSVVFEGNTASASSSSDSASAYGGAIDGDVTMTGNGDVSFSGNTASSSSSDYSASAYGGAIHGDVTMTGNGDVSFSGNTASSSSSSYTSRAYACGGAIAGDVTMTGNGDVSFSGNTASGSSYAYGGAIRGHEGSTITLSNNGSVTFSGNTASGSSYAYGGAIYGYTITLSNNGSVVFQGNTASSDYAYAYGGAICGSVTMALSNNGSVTFSGNTASSSDDNASGGAIYGGDGRTITLSDNGSVTFSGNTASSYYDAYGGAIYGYEGSTITLSDNGSVSFSGNTASYSASSSNFFASGGAIYSRGDLSIRNNDSVEFYQNAEVVSGNTYRLRSIYADGGSDDEISLSAAAGKSITFRDSVYISSGSTFKLNEAYEGKAQLGDIIFTGATTVDDLYTVKGNVAGTTEEIQLSRTSEVYTLTKLYGGRLRVEDGAIYQGQGITAMEGSGATVRVQNAELSHGGYVLEFNAGTALEVAGNSTIRGNVNLLADSLFKLEQAATLSLYETLQADAATLTVKGSAMLEGASTLNASLTLADGATLDMMSLDAGAVTINGALTLGGQVKMGEHLLAAVEALTCWEPGLVLFTGLTNLTLPVAASELESDRVLASSVFSNVVNSDLYVTYHVVDNVGSLMVMSVPEPTTTSLSLAALVALAMRRRRR